MRINNTYDVISTENLEEIQNEYILRRIAARLFKTVCLPSDNEDSQSEALDYLFCDFEARYLDLCYISLTNFSRFFKTKQFAKIKSQIDQPRLIQRLRHLVVGDQQESFLFEIDEETEQQENQDLGVKDMQDQDLVTQSSLVKRASVSSVKLNIEYLKRKALNCKILSLGLKDPKIVYDG